MKKYTEEEWNRLSKKEKSKAKEKAGLFVVSAGILLFWRELTKSAKWSVFRWWVLYAAFMGSGLFTTYREITGSYSGRLDGYWKTHDDNGFAIFILIVIGITIFYIYRNNFFKSRANHKKLSTIPLIIFFFSSIAISQLGRYHIYKQKVPGQKMEVYYTNPLSFFQDNNSKANYSSENQLGESRQVIKEIIPEPSTYIEPVNPVPNYDDPGGVSENIIDTSEFDISEYEEEELRMSNLRIKELQKMLELRDGIQDYSSDFRFFSGLNLIRLTNFNHPEFIQIHSDLIKIWASSESFLQRIIDNINKNTYYGPITTKEGSLRTLKIISADREFFTYSFGAAQGKSKLPITKISANSLINMSISYDKKVPDKSLLEESIIEKTLFSYVIGNLSQSAEFSSQISDELFKELWSRILEFERSK